MKIQTTLAIGFATFMALAAQANQERLAQSIKEARMEGERTSEQLKATLGAITTMTKQTKGDLRPAYDAYCAEVTRTDKEAAATRTRVIWMAGDGRHYFQDWQKTIDGINNESLRKKAQKRLDSVRLNFDGVEQSLKLAAEKFRPFLADLADIQKALATDITPGGVKAIRGTVNTANWDHKYVKPAIDAALKGMRKMEKSLSTEAK